MSQVEAEIILGQIYTPEKKAIWDKKMGVAGKKFEDNEISFGEYMQFRRNLRKELGFPA